MLRNATGSRDDAPSGTNRSGGVNGESLDVGHLKRVIPPGEED